MITEALDFRYLLLENYKKMKISENELATILMIEHLINDGNSFITADLLSLKMSLDAKEIDKIIALLLTKGFMEYVTENGNTKCTLSPLKERLYHEFQITLNENTMNSEGDSKESFKNIYTEFEKTLARPLSPVEISKIREWISMGYEDEKIINALKESIAQGKKTLRNVDKILLMWSTREDREAEGHSPIGNGWDKNLEETIRIAKTPWIKKDDDEN